MEQMRLEYPLGMLCRVLGVSVSGFHASRSRGLSRRAQQEARLEIEIRAAHQRTHRELLRQRPHGELLGNAEDGVDFSSPFCTREQAIREITEYIEVFYNRQRLQRQLDYLSPTAFERRYHEQRLAA